MTTFTKHTRRSLKYALRKKLFTLYASLKYNTPLWRVLNSKAIHSFTKQQPDLSPVQQRILKDLRDTGIATAQLHELFPGENILSELQTYTAKREDRASQNHKKKFIDDLLPEIPELGTEIPFTQVAMSPTILNIVNSYIGMHSRLYYFMLRRTRKSINTLPKHSQNWHRAPQEKINCRVYIYLSEVCETSGPLMYIPHSRSGEKYGSVARQTALSRGYNSAEVIETHVAHDDIKTINGPAGTVIFCDATGLHRGGYSAVDTRTMSTFGYGAPSFRENIHYSYSKNFLEQLSSTPVAQEALNPKWVRDTN